VIRKAAIVAMYTMPTREALFKKVNNENVRIFFQYRRMAKRFFSFVLQVCGDNAQRNIDILPKMLEITADVFDRTDNVYESYRLHTLP